MAELETTPLAAVTSCGQTDIVCFLLDNDVSVDVKSLKGLSLLYILIRGGFEVIVTMLLEWMRALGVNVDFRDYQGMTPLYYATQFASETAIIDLLIQHGALINAVANNGVTPLHYAARHASGTAVIDLLIQHGASINAMTHVDVTPLCVAAGLGNVNICRSLMNHNADIELGGWVYGTPLVCAVQGDHIAVTELLLRRGVNTETRIRLITEVDSYGLRTERITTLMLAAWKARPEIVKLLLAHGAYADKFVGEALVWARHGGWWDWGNLERKELCIDLL